jgi:hypothetical protein
MGLKEEGARDIIAVALSEGGRFSPAIGFGKVEWGKRSSL